MASPKAIFLRKYRDSAQLSPVSADDDNNKFWPNSSSGSHMNNEHHTTPAGIAPATPTDLFPLRVLIIDDSPADAELIVRELKSSFLPTFRRVDTPEALHEALAISNWDIIISDYVMPRFSGLAALDLLKSLQLDIPVVVVSGKMGEEVAVETMRAGASDYVVKDHLSRLVPIIRRELKEASARREQQSIENALLLAETKFRSLVEQSLSGIFIIQENHFSYINPRFAQIFGYTQDEILSLDSILDIVAPESRPFIAANLEKRLHGEPPQEPYTIEGIRKDNSTIFIEVQGTKAEFTGRPAIIGTLLDVTLRKQTEEDLRKLSHAVEQSPVSIVITKQDGLIEYVNPKFCQLTGYTAAEATELNLHNLKSQLMPEEEYRQMWETITAGKEWHGEIRNRKKDGELFWERVSISAIKNEHGAITNFVEVKEDITEQRRSKESERRNWKLSETMATASLRFLETGNINDMAQVLVEQCVSLTNSALGFLYDLLPSGDARVLAVSASLPHGREGCNVYRTMIGHLARDGFYLAKRGECPLFRRALTGDTLLVNSSEEFALLFNQEEFSCTQVSSFLGTPLRVGTSIVGMIGLANKPDGFTEQERREIEAFAQTAALALYSARAELEHKQAMDQLRQAQKMEAIGQLAGGIAHDFNNLLTVINGYSSLLLHEIPRDSQFRNEIEFILHAGERAADLTQQLLAFSRRQILEPKVININHLVRNVEKMLKRLIRENIVLQTCLAEKIGAVKADPTQVEQIIINLLVNARDAVGDGGIITIETGDVYLDESFILENRGAIAGHYVMLAVHDNGVGMSQETKQKIFEPFFTTKSKGSGTGLGLSTVYGIVKQSNGYIQVTSSINAGSSFRVFLPCIDEENSDDGEQSTTLPKEGSGTILIVEDEEGVLLLALHTLRRQGYNVLHTRDPIIAEQLFAQHHEQIDLLLSDVVMPGKSGPQLGKNFREIRPDLKILFMSGYTDDTIMPHRVAGEPTAFILKPFTPDSLADKVREVLEMPSFHQPWEE